MENVEDNIGIGGENEELIEAQKRSDAAEAHLSFCIKDVMKTESGRHFVMWLLESNSLNEDVFDKDPYLHALKSGCRVVAVALRKRLLSDCPDNYYRMCLEHKYEEEKQDGE